MENEPLNLASTRERLINLIVDLLVAITLWLAIGASIELLRYGFASEDTIGARIDSLPSIIFVITWWSYYILTEFLFQRTLGKLVTKTKVVTTTGEKPTITWILIRTLSRSVPFEALTFLLSESGLHDRISKTKVVKIQ